MQKRAAPDDVDGSAASLFDKIAVGEVQKTPPPQLRYLSPIRTRYGTTRISRATTFVTSAGNGGEAANRLNERAPATRRRRFYACRGDTDRIRPRDLTGLTA